jgi:hypothetical protein
LGYALGTYSDATLDHRELVKLLLNAKFKWVLSEYWNPIYAPLGEPIRIRVDKPMANSNHTDGKRKEGVECLWTNFEPNYLTERNSMPKIDTGDLLAALQKDRDEIDAAIRALTRTINKNFSPDAPDGIKRSGAKVQKGSKKKRASRPYPSPETRRKLSEAAKKRWAKA